MVQTRTWHDEHRSPGMRGDIVRDTPLDERRQSSEAARTDHDQSGTDLVSNLDKTTPGRRGQVRTPECAESEAARQLHAFVCTRERIAEKLLLYRAGA